MYRISYESHFKIAPEKIAEAEPRARDLFKLWNDNVDTERMTLSFDPTSGWFAFDTRGDCEVPRWLTDDTPMLLRELGRLSRRGTMVRHTKGGEGFDFPVGPNILSERQAVEMEKILNAIDALRLARAVVPEDVVPEIDNAMAVLDKLCK